MKVTPFWFELRNLGWVLHWRSEKHHMKSISNCLAVSWNCVEIFISIVRFRDFKSVVLHHLTRLIHLGSLYQYLSLLLKMHRKVTNFIWKCQILLGNTKFHLKMPKLTWKYQISPENAKFYLKLPNFTWKCQILPENAKFHLKMPDFICTQVWNVDKVFECKSSMRMRVTLSIGNHVATYKLKKYHL